MIDPQCPLATLNIECKFVADILLALFYKVLHEKLFLSETTGLQPFAQAEGAHLLRVEQIRLRTFPREYLYFAEI